MAKDTYLHFRCTDDQRAQVDALAAKFAGGNISALVLGLTVGDGSEALAVALDDSTVAQLFWNWCQVHGHDWRALAKAALVDAMRSG